MNTVIVKVDPLANLVKYFTDINADVSAEYQNDALFKDVRYLKEKLFINWYHAYLENHPEYDGFNDSAIDAFWIATEEAGFTEDDVHNGLTALEK
jgi:hypothetical protein